ncbi:MAG: hypothetical protein N3H30_02245 [Candidatus Micrarchaeota archaeon]|nr:hypothetical protein [Candidatus Micrarchaeota archaeon]
MAAPRQDPKKEKEETSKLEGDATQGAIAKEPQQGKVSGTHYSSPKGSAEEHTGKHSGGKTGKEGPAEMVERQAAESAAVDAKAAEPPPVQPAPQVADIKNIDIALDTYNDIFSDFDISPYSKRQLSEDFIIEMLRRVPTSSPGTPVKVVLSIPQGVRSPQDEKVIHKRIRHVFSKKLQEIEGEIRAYQQKGLKYMAVGAGIILLTLVETDWPVVNAIFNILLVPGWFGIWTGLSKIFDEPAELVKARKAYHALSTAQYVFVSEEDVKKTLG